MARKRMVTRTIKGEQLTVLCVRTDTRETFESNIVLTERFKTDSKKLTHIATIFDEEGSPVKPVAIINSTPIKTRYGMTEEMFVKYAHEILDDGLGEIIESEDE